MDTQSLTLALGDATHAGRTFDVLPVAGDEPVLQVTVSGAEETPVYVTVTDTQILCLAYLFDKQELNPEQMNDLHENMLRISVPMPLSALGKTGDHYVVYGALSPTSGTAEIMQELVTLAENAIDLLQTFEDYLA
ncbi:YjfI family protein [Marinobacter sp. HN1S83]|uniref:YjfI family protein n=1 Tax=Marinobacter sp. HN1S83 TaxID=3382301 RepID=UPI00387B6576